MQHDIFSQLPWPYILLLLTNHVAFLFNCETHELVKYSFIYNPNTNIIEFEDVVIIQQPFLFSNNGNNNNNEQDDSFHLQHQLPQLTSDKAVPSLLSNEIPQLSYQSDSDVINSIHTDHYSKPGSLIALCTCQGSSNNTTTTQNTSNITPSQQHQQQQQQQQHGQHGHQHYHSHNCCFNSLNQSRLENYIQEYINIKHRGSTSHGQSTGTGVSSNINNNNNNINNIQPKTTTTTTKMMMNPTSPNTLSNIDIALPSTLPHANSQNITTTTQTTTNTPPYNPTSPNNNNTNLSFQDHLDDITRNINKNQFNVNNNDSYHHDKMRNNYDNTITDHNKTNDDKKSSTIIFPQDRIKNVPNGNKADYIGDSIDNNINGDDDDDNHPKELSSNHDSFTTSIPPTVVLTPVEYDDNYDIGPGEFEYEDEFDGIGNRINYTTLHHKENNLITINSGNNNQTNNGNNNRPTPYIELATPPMRQKTLNSTNSHDIDLHSTKHINTHNSHSTSNIPNNTSFKSYNINNNNNIENDLTPHQLDSNSNRNSNNNNCSDNNTNLTLNVSSDINNNPQLQSPSNADFLQSNAFSGVTNGFNNSNNNNYGLLFPNSKDINDINNDKAKNSTNIDLDNNINNINQSIQDQFHLPVSPDLQRADSFIEINTATLLTGQQNHTINKFQNNKKQSPLYTQHLFNKNNAIQSLNNYNPDLLPIIPKKHGIVPLPNGTIIQNIHRQQKQINPTLKSSAQNLLNNNPNNNDYISPIADISDHNNDNELSTFQREQHRKLPKLIRDMIIYALLLEYATNDEIDHDNNNNDDNDDSEEKKKFDNERIIQDNISNNPILFSHSTIDLIDSSPMDDNNEISNTNILNTGIKPLPFKDSPETNQMDQANQPINMSLTNIKTDSMVPTRPKNQYYQQNRTVSPPTHFAQNALVTIPKNNHDRNSLLTHYNGLTPNISHLLTNTSRPQRSHNLQLSYQNDQCDLDSATVENNSGDVIGPCNFNGNISPNIRSVHQLHQNIRPRSRASSHSRTNKFNNPKVNLNANVTNHDNIKSTSILKKNNKNKPDGVFLGKVMKVGDIEIEVVDVNDEIDDINKDNGSKNNNNNNNNNNANNDNNNLTTMGLSQNSSFTGENNNENQQNDLSVPIQTISLDTDLDTLPQKYNDNITKQNSFTMNDDDDHYIDDYYIKTTTKQDNNDTNHDFNINDNDFSSTALTPTQDTNNIITSPTQLTSSYNFSNATSEAVENDSSSDRVIYLSPFYFKVIALLQSFLQDDFVDEGNINDNNDISNHNVGINSYDILTGDDTNDNHDDDITAKSTTPLSELNIDIAMNNTNDSILNNNNHENYNDNKNKKNGKDDHGDDDNHKSYNTKSTLQVSTPNKETVSFYDDIDISINTGVLSDHFSICNKCHGHIPKTITTTPIPIPNTHTPIPNTTKITPSLSQFNQTNPNKQTNNAYPVSPLEQPNAISSFNLHNLGSANDNLNNNNNINLQEQAQLHQQHQKQQQQSNRHSSSNSPNPFTSTPPFNQNNYKNQPHLHSDNQLKAMIFTILGLYDELNSNNINIDNDNPNASPQLNGINRPTPQPPPQPQGSSDKMRLVNNIFNLMGNNMNDDDSNNFNNSDTINDVNNAYIQPITPTHIDNQHYNNDNQYYNNNIDDTNNDDDQGEDDITEVDTEVLKNHRKSIGFNNIGGIGNTNSNITSLSPACTPKITPIRSNLMAKKSPHMTPTITHNIRGKISPKINNIIKGDDVVNFDKGGINTSKKDQTFINSIDDVDDIMLPAPIIYTHYSDVEMNRYNRQHSRERNGSDAKKKNIKTPLFTRIQPEHNINIPNLNNNYNIDDINNNDQNKLVLQQTPPPHTTTTRRKRSLSSSKLTPYKGDSHRTNPNILTRANAYDIDNNNDNNDTNNMLMITNENANALITHFNHQSHQYHPMLLLPPPPPPSSLSSLSTTETATIGINYQIVPLDLDINQGDNYHDYDTNHNYKLVDPNDINYSSNNNDNTGGFGLTHLSPNFNQNQLVLFSGDKSFIHNNNVHLLVETTRNHYQHNNNTKNNNNAYNTMNNNDSSDIYPSLMYRPKIDDVQNNNNDRNLKNDKNDKNDLTINNQQNKLLAYPLVQRTPTSLLQSWTDDYYSTPLKSTPMYSSTGNNNNTTSTNLNSGNFKLNTNVNNNTGSYTNMLQTNDKDRMDQDINFSHPIDIGYYTSHGSNNDTNMLNTHTNNAVVVSANTNNNNTNNDIDDDDLFYNELLQSSAHEKHYTTNYKELRLLGRGATGEVVLVEHTLGSYHIGFFALKKVPLRSKLTAEKAMREIRNGEMLQCRYLTLYRHSWLQQARGIMSFGPNDDNANTTEANTKLQPFLFILQQYCHYGGLENILYPSDKQWIALESSGLYNDKEDNINNDNFIKIKHTNDIENNNEINNTITPHSNKIPFRTKQLISSIVFSSLRLPYLHKKEFIPFQPSPTRFYTFQLQYPRFFKLPYTTKVTSPPEITIYRDNSYQYQQYISYLHQFIDNMSPKNANTATTSSIPQGNNFSINHNSNYNINNDPNKVDNENNNSNDNKKTQTNSSSLLGLSALQHSSISLPTRNEQNYNNDSAMNNNNNNNNNNTNINNIINNNDTTLPFTYSSSPLPTPPIILTEDLIWVIFIDIVLGLAYLHSHGMSHRDVKIENVLLTDDTESYSKYMNMIKRSRKFYQKIDPDIQCNNADIIPSNNDNNNTNVNNINNNSRGNINANVHNFNNNTNNNNKNNSHQQTQNQQQQQQQQTKTFAPVYTTIPNMLLGLSSSNSTVNHSPTQKNHPYPPSSTTVYTQLHPNDSGVDVNNGKNELSSYLSSCYQIDLASIDNTLVRSPLHLSLPPINPSERSSYFHNLNSIDGNNNNNLKLPYNNSHHDTATTTTSLGMTQRELYLRLRKEQRSNAHGWGQFVNKMTSPDQQQQSQQQQQKQQHQLGERVLNSANTTSTTTTINTNNILPHYHKNRLFRFSHALMADFGASMTHFDNYNNINHNNQNGYFLVGHSGTMQYSSPELLLSFGLALLNNHYHDKNNIDDNKNSGVNPTKLTTGQQRYNVRMKQLENVLPLLNSHVTSTSLYQSNISHDHHHDHNNTNSITLHNSGSSSSNNKPNHDTPLSTLTPFISSQQSPHLHSFRHQLQTTESQIQQDIWALGVLLYVLAYNHFPFSPSSLDGDDDVIGQILALGDIINNGYNTMNIKNNNKQDDHANNNHNNGNNNKSSSISTPSYISFPTFSITTTNTTTPQSPTDTTIITPRSISLQLMCMYILNPMPSLRPTVFEILSHPILRAHDFAGRM